MTTTTNKPAAKQDHTVRMVCTLCEKETDELKVVCDRYGDIDYLWCGCEPKMVLLQSLLADDKDAPVPF